MWPAGKTEPSPCAPRSVNPPTEVEQTFRLCRLISRHYSRRVRFPILALVLFLALAAPASAQTPAEFVGGLTIHREPCPYYPDGGGCATPETGEIWIEPGAPAFRVWHEAGHVLDYRKLTPPMREQFIGWFHFPAGTPWNTGTGPGTRSPSEVFADAVAACHTERRRRAGRMTITASATSYGFAPRGARERRKICNAIAFVAAS